MIRVCGFRRVELGSRREVFAVVGTPRGTLEILGVGEKREAGRHGCVHTGGKRVATAKFRDVYAQRVRGSVSVNCIPAVLSSSTSTDGRDSQLADCLPFARRVERFFSCANTLPHRCSPSPFSPTRDIHNGSPIHARVTIYCLPYDTSVRSRNRISGTGTTVFISYL